MSEGAGDGRGRATGEPPGEPPGPDAPRRATLGDLFAEMKRRHVFRVMVGYGVFAFAVLQVTEPIMHGADLPNWVLKAVLVALALGFPVAVILAWVYDLTAQGVKRTPSAKDPGAPRFGTSRLLLPIAVSAAVLAIAAAGAGGWYAWKRTVQHRPAPAAGDPPSIAVLPFKDLSPDHDQEYFSDGMAEEILTALSKVKGLRVPGRESSFYFKGKNVEPGEIAQKLGVAHLLAGSVRRSGTKLRISAEVVRASDGERIWSQAFNRDLTDVFAIQDEISRDVVEALRVKLMPGQSPPPKEYRTSNQEAYQSFLLGLHFGRSFSRDSIRNAIAAVEKAVALDPSFVRAWAQLASGRLVAGILGAIPWDEARRGGLLAAERAVALGPDEPVTYNARLWARLMEWDWRGAREDLDRVRELAPDGEYSNGWTVNSLFWTGQFQESVPLFQRAIEMEQLRAGLWNGFGIALGNSGRFEEADRAFARALEVDPSSETALADRGITLVLAGRPAEGLVYCVRAQRLDCQAMAHHALGDSGQSQRALDAMLATDVTERGAYTAAMVHAFRAKPDEAFRWLERAYAMHSHNLGQIAGDIAFRSLHGDPRWKAFLARMGLPVGTGATTATAVDSATAQPSIAVLPFADMSPKHDQEYFADGVAEEIRNALSHVEGLKVIGRTSSFSFKGKPDDLRTIGQKLGVANVLEGSLRKDGNGVRISAQLIRVVDGAHLWSASYTRKLTGIFEVQEEIARAVVGALKVKLLPAAGKGRSAIPEAYTQWLLFRQILAQARDGKDYERAARALGKVLALDPNYAPAWAWVALGHGVRAISAVDDQVRTAEREEGRRAAAKAIDLAPESAEGYEARGWLMFLGLDLPGARSDLEKAVRLDPSSGEAWWRLGMVYLALGRLQEAADATRRSTELDPLWALRWLGASEVRIAAGDLRGAREAALRALEIAPGFEDAIETIRKLDLIEGRAAQVLEEAGRDPDAADRLYWTALAEQALGRQEASARLREEFTARYGGESPLRVARLQARASRVNDAFSSLDRALARRPVYGGLAMQLRYDPLLTNLHADPRWKPFLRKMKLPVD